jgi:hypothetical protein
MHILFYMPILPLVYQTLEYAATIGTCQGSLLMIHQHHFSLLVGPTPLVVNHWMESS